MFLNVLALALHNRETISMNNLCMLRKEVSPLFEVLLRQWRGPNFGEVGNLDVGVRKESWIHFFSLQEFSIKEMRNIQRYCLSFHPIDWMVMIGSLLTLMLDLNTIIIPCILYGVNTPEILCTCIFVVAFISNAIMLWMYSDMDEPQDRNAPGPADQRPLNRLLGLHTIISIVLGVLFAFIPRDSTPSGLVLLQSLTLVCSYFYNVLSSLSLILRRFEHTDRDWNVRTPPTQSRSIVNPRFSNSKDNYSALVTGDIELKKDPSDSALP